MSKIKTVKEFVEKMDAAKKVNPKDLSSDQDLSIGIMNLISIEEHLMFSGAKTGKTEFYNMINGVRDLRKRMMQKIIPSYEGEVWCISKHLLAASMRLFEVGTKAQSSGDAAQANELFDESYNLYCLFWGLNMGMIGGDLKYAAAPKSQKATKAAQPAAIAPAPMPETAKGGMSKLKNWVKNAVNCCIE
ncbi:hypothetical protein HDR63_02430 [bacterium]|nr:hypothetical protein [bacterium]